MRLGLDLSGGDFAPRAALEGALAARCELPDDVEIVLIGDASTTRNLLVDYGADSTQFSLVHAPEIIGMDEQPARAFKLKHQSSIHVGFALLKSGQIDVFASAGNTGAMMAGSMLSIHPIEGVIRPSIGTCIPRPDGGINLILDVGINSDCKADVLYQFGILGSLYSQHVLNVARPRVGLLNIGEEEEKGNLISKAAHELMKDSSDFHFIGNIEGRDIFTDKADVIVCDGFTGNVVLKEAEAFYTLLKSRGINDDYFDRFNYELYGGTAVLGVNGNVIIGHGISGPTAIKNMLRHALEVAKSSLPEKIKKAFTV
jgi:glycerol-3-phosphate acyltransferase PlsX